MDLDNFINYYLIVVGFAFSAYLLSKGGHKSLGERSKDAAYYHKYPVLKHLGEILGVLIFPIALPILIVSLPFWLIYGLYGEIKQYVHEKNNPPEPFDWDKVKMFTNNPKTNMIEINKKKVEKIYTDHCEKVKEK